MNGTTKPINQKAWWLVLPVLLCVAFSAIVPLMTVVNYSVQDIISPERRVFVGTEWFASVMRDDELHAALWRQLGFSLAVLLVEIPLGICLALSMPAHRLEVFRRAGDRRAVAADPVERGRHHLADLRPRRHRPASARRCRRSASTTATPATRRDAWLTVLVMDVWHWTPLVALLCYRRPALDPRCLLPGRAHRRREPLRGVPLHPAAQDARRADDRGAAALHGQLHDLHRALRADGRRAGQRDHLPEPVPHAEGRGPVRPRAGGGVLADLFPDHPAACASCSTTGCSASVRRKSRRRNEREKIPQAQHLPAAVHRCSRCCPSTGWST